MENDNEVDVLEEADENGYKKFRRYCHLEYFGLIALQQEHDNLKEEENMHEALEKWINENVEDAEISNNL